MLELEVGKAEERFGIKKMALGSFIKAAGIDRLLLSLRTCLFLRNLSRRTVGLPTLVLMKSPQLGDTISALTRRVNGRCTSKREAGGQKMVRNNNKARRNVSPKKLFVDMTCFT